MLGAILIRISTALVGGRSARHILHCSMNGKYCTINRTTKKWNQREKYINILPSAPHHFPFDAQSLHDVVWVDLSWISHRGDYRYASRNGALPSPYPRLQRDKLPISRTPKLNINISLQHGEYVNSVEITLHLARFFAHPFTGTPGSVLDSEAKLTTLKHFTECFQFGID